MFIAKAICLNEFLNFGQIKLRFPGIFHSNQSPRREEKIEGPLWGIDLWRGAKPLDVKFHQGQPEASGETQTTNYINLKYKIHFAKVNILYIQLKLFALISSKFVFIKIRIISVLFNVYHVQSKLRINQLKYSCFITKRIAEHIVVRILI
ncbi:Hypothetical_protein [Hexamita inflata]|uniref:Hypothetical_protein n=1 Tax=Hexamita inflata TaxID=28002 RepID=A0AA86Q055_9EUKA|nr:Hypothetical protein HINF_LOCUS37264 [Hexamita inflata]